MSVKTPVKELNQTKTRQSVKLANAAIFYHPDGYDTSGPKLMGRQAAGESFLKAFVRHAEIDTLACYAESENFYRDFLARVEGFANRRLKTHWVKALDIQALGQIGCLSVPGPGLKDYVWLRRHGNLRAFSVCGITHTTCSGRVMNAIGDLLIAPVQPWDAVICTSHSVRTMLIKELEAYHEYLCQRLGAKIMPNVVQLPVIPLGIDWRAFQPDRESEVYKQKFKEQHHIKENDITVLFVGRLAFHAKAHPLPMYMALEQAAQQAGKKIHLVLAGWFANDFIQQQFVEAARQLCPSVNLIIEDARQPETRKNIWHVADIFTSLSDNIQETFGLTPVEAMAAGLPVVVTDWDGYREAVTHGIHGFTIPTMMPEPGNGDTIALRHAAGVENYDHYIGQVAQTTAVDIDATAQAFITLINNPALRQKMGEAGRQHTRRIYDWPMIIRAYQTLWGQLAELRKTASMIASRPDSQPVNPLRDDPYRLFEHYATRPIHPNSRITLTENNRERLKHAFSLKMNRLGLLEAIPLDQFQRLLSSLEKQPNILAYELAKTSSMPAPMFYQALGWLAKMGIIQI